MATCFAYGQTGQRVLHMDRPDLGKLTRWAENSMGRLKTPKMEFMRWQQETCSSILSHPNIRTTTWLSPAAFSRFTVGRCLICCPASPSCGVGGREAAGGGGGADGVRGGLCG